ncbi:hypothetical protein COU80_03130 [Candidatus Peregrinibacteria bacterium CG10_big_fil_rev_8_21_14_0_10_55_24]|nr:MAG: hypothetical protein COU80_03130 [Candidatus Peregrinibacteria bacterium CG10_big_fil_rev_8_21_14_0_10_55_24]
MELIADAGMRVRTMEDTEQEYALLLKWLTNPTVEEWYENRAGQTVDAIKAKYRPRVVGESHIQAAIIEWHSAPVGYLQFYETREEKEYNVKEPLLEQPHVWAMDILIGEPDHFGKGIGSTALKLMLRYLFEQRSAKTVIIDPDMRNTRAIRAYEKAGFRKLKILRNWEQHTGQPTDAWLMVCNKTTRK